MQGSGVWAGVHDLETEYEKTDRNGNALVDELKRIDYRGTEPCTPHQEYGAYLELHIEQGPSLDESDSQIGVVTGIVGQTWVRQRIEVRQITRDRRQCTSGRTHWSQPPKSS